MEIPVSTRNAEGRAIAPRMDWFAIAHWTSRVQVMDNKSENNY
jgi:hypothetical protein